MEEQQVSEDFVRRVSEYVAELKYLITAVNGSEEIALTLLQQIAKDRRCDQVNGKRHGDSEQMIADNDGTPATRKQVEYLKDLGVAVPRGLTKSRASELLDEHAGQR